MIRFFFWIEFLRIFFSWNLKIVGYWNTDIFFFKTQNLNIWCKAKEEQTKKKQNNKPLLLSKWWLNYFRFFSFIFPDQWTIESGSYPIQNIAIIIIDIDIIKMSPCSVETTINKDKKQTNIIIKCIGIIFFADFS